MDVWYGLIIFGLVLFAWVAYENHRQAKEKKKNN